MGELRARVNPIITGTTDPDLLVMGPFPQVTSELTPEDISACQYQAGMDLEISKNVAPFRPSCSKAAFKLKGSAKT